MSSCVTTHKLKITTLGTSVTREWINLSTGLVETDAALITQLEASLVATDNDCVTCDLFDYYTLEGTNGVDVQQWLDTAIEGAGLQPVFDIFSDTDGEGYPAHPNLPDNVSVSNNFDVVTSQTGSSHQSIYESYVYFPEAGFIRDRDTAAEQGIAMIGLCCGPLSQAGDQWELTPPRQWNGGLGYPVPAGLHRIRVYIHDSAGTNGGFDLEFSTDNVTFANVADENLFTDKPTWVCNKGYICDGNLFELDKTTPVVLDEYTALCPQECNAVSAGSSGGDSIKCKTVCKCDDVNGDGTVIESYCEFYTLEVDGTNVTSTSLGTFTDGSLTTAYTPVNPIDCGDIGDEAYFEALPHCDGTTTFWRVMDKISGNVIRNFDADGNSYTPAGTVTAGACCCPAPANTAPFANNRVTHTVTNGTNTSIPAGFGAVSVKAISNDVVVDGWPMEEFEVYHDEATQLMDLSGELPAYTITGTSWVWRAIDVINS